MFIRLHQAIGRLSSTTADFAGHSMAQIAVLIGCAVWLAFGASEEVVASTMTIGSFVLTQMVLNQQRRRESALHLKIDELLHAVEGARSEVVGAEHEEENRIEELRRDR